MLLWTVPLNILAALVLNGFVVHAVFQRLRGNAAPVGSSVAIAVGRVVPIVGTIVVQFLLLCLAFVPAIAVVVFAITTNVSMESRSLLIPIAALVGYPFAVWLLIRWYLATAVVVVEGRWGTAALRRSFHLMRGLFWRVFGISIVFGLMMGIPTAVLTVVLGEASHALFVVNAVITLLFFSLQSAFAGVLYHDVREAREGIGLDDLERVFA